jgi:ATP-dependent RNA helicase RhlE
VPEIFDLSKDAGENPDRRPRRKPATSTDRRPDPSPPPSPDEFFDASREERSEVPSHDREGPPREEEALWEDEEPRGATDPRDELPAGGHEDLSDDDLDDELDDEIEEEPADSLEDDPDDEDEDEDDEVEDPSAFLALGIEEQIARAVADEGYTVPTEVQRRSIPDAISGRDVMGLAQTGTGKTAAFSIPILQRLHLKPRRGKRAIRALVLTPTRELAIQVQESLETYGRHLPLRSTVIMGGVSAVPQIAELRRTPDVLVATPGRLLDLISQGHIRLDQIEMFVLDEADRMLDMGFIHDVQKVVEKLPELRQTLFFSATMPKEVERLAKQLLTRPIRVEVTPRTSVPRKIDQRIFMVARLDKRKLLAHLLKNTKGARRVLVFARTKRRADSIVRHVKKLNVNVAAIHSNKAQGARQKALAGFSQGKIRVLIATDIVARGIDVEEITHVINYDLPFEPESYVHRIGRTARAGAVGVAYSFCDGEEIPLLKQIEKVMKSPIEVETDHPFHTTEFEPPPEKPAPSRGRSRAAGGASDRPAGRRGGRGRGRSRDTEFVEDAPRRSRRRGSRGVADRERERSEHRSRRDHSEGGESRRARPERDRSEPRGSRREGGRRLPDEGRRREPAARTGRSGRSDSFSAGIDDNFGDSANIFGGGGRARPTSGPGAGPARRSSSGGGSHRRSEGPGGRSGGEARRPSDGGRPGGRSRRGGSSGGRRGGSSGGRRRSS